MSNARTEIIFNHCSPEGVQLPHICPLGGDLVLSNITGIIAISYMD